MRDIYKVLQKCTGFEWDEYNAKKNWENHKVTPSECEQIFFNKPLIMADDAKHSEYERRCFILGKTDLHRKLFIVFTIRNKLIRVISARDMNKKEKRRYEEHEKE
ncbi:MAG: BrnT family toxin [Candidatus Ratteibacteria bacterium]|nr:BrnT family toxin [Candidatus Ratteibacteria bacterium]